MANVFLAAQVYANVMLLQFKNRLVMGRLVDGTYKNQVSDNNGLSVSVKRPPRFVATDGAALKAQDLVTGSKNVSVTRYRNVHISIGDLESVTSFNALMKNETMKAAASTLAHDVDNYLASKTLGFHSFVSGGNATGGVNATLLTKGLTTSAAALSARTRLAEMGAPDGALNGIITDNDSELIRGSLATSNIQSENASALLRTRVPMISDVNWYSTQQCPSFTCGTRVQGNGSSTGAQIDGAAVGVNYRAVKDTNKQTLTLKTGGNGLTYKVGDVFTIAGAYAWDWRNQVALPYLQQFTIVGDSTGAAVDSTSTAGGAVTVTISPPIIVQGSNDGVNTYANSAFGTVSALPADSAYVQFAGAASTALQVRSVFAKQAIALVSCPLQMPYTGVASFATDPETGISIRYWRGSDITTGAHVHRWDMIYGAELMEPFLGTRAIGPNT